MNMKSSGNKYGLSTTTDTHMIKNSEWGAVSYLSHSQYGMCINERCKEININNSSSYYTGRSGGNASGSTLIKETYPSQTSSSQYNTYGFYTYDGYLLDYNTNTKTTTKDLSKVSSTTGNIYGVYDMSGGAYEYMMANIVSPDGNTMISGNTATYNSGYSGIVYNNNKYSSYTGTYEYPNKKYYDKYSYNLSSSIITSKLGDGIKEVLKVGLYGWYNDLEYPAYATYSWFVRGGESTDQSAGIYYTAYSYGGSGSDCSTRLIMIVDK